MSNLPIDTNGVDREVIDIKQKIMDEQDVNKVKNMTAVFNLLQQKKNLLRVLKLNGLLDTVSDKIVQRFEQRPDEFSNSDLVAYMKVIEDANNAGDIVQNGETNNESEDITNAD